MPEFLLTVFAKNERANLTTGERNDLRRLTQVLVRQFKGETYE